MSTSGSTVFSLLQLLLLLLLDTCRGYMDSRVSGMATCPASLVKEHSQFCMSQW